MAPPGTTRVTYFPVRTQRQLEHNRALVRDKPYARYFDDDLWLHDAVLPAIRAPMDPADALRFEDIDSLLEPGYQRVENGYCELPDGGGYVASCVPFVGCTGEMYRWWFWWHAVDSARYTLWYPHNHISVRPLDREPLTRPGLRHEERYVGTTHHVDEFIGPERLQVAIRFVDPATLGLDTGRFEAAGIVGHACARVRLLQLPPVEAVTMVHLARQTEHGIEQRSRYWLGHDTKLSVLGTEVSIDGFASRMGFKRRMAGARVAYEQLLHDQIEFTHLSTFLADIYREFGSAE
jgi:hypothetical protein